MGEDLKFWDMEKMVNHVYIYIYNGYLYTMQYSCRVFPKIARTVASSCNHVRVEFLFGTSREPSEVPFWLQGCTTYSEFWFFVWFWNLIWTKTKTLKLKTYGWLVVPNRFIFIPTWGNDPIWRICFKWVETTNQLVVFAIIFFLKTWKAFRTVAQLQLLALVRAALRLYRCLNLVVWIMI